MWGRSAAVDEVGERESREQSSVSLPPGALEALARLLTSPNLLAASLAAYLLCQVACMGAHPKSSAVWSLVEPAMDAMMRSWAQVKTGGSAEQVAVLQVVLAAATAAAAQQPRSELVSALRRLAAGVPHTDAAALRSACCHALALLSQPVAASVPAGPAAGARTPPHDPDADAAAGGAGGASAAAPGESHAAAASAGTALAGDAKDLMPQPLRELLLLQAMAWDRIWQLASLMVAVRDLGEARSSSDCGRAPQVLDTTAILQVLVEALSSPLLLQDHSAQRMMWAQLPCRAQAGLQQAQAAAARDSLAVQEGTLGRLVDMTLAAQDPSKQEALLRCLLAASHSKPTIGDACAAHHPLMDSLQAQVRSSSKCGLEEHEVLQLQAVARLYAVLLECGLSALPAPPTAQRAAASKLPPTAADAPDAHCDCAGDGQGFHSRRLPLLPTPLVTGLPWPRAAALPGGAAGLEARSCPSFFADSPRWPGCGAPAAAAAAADDPEAASELPVSCSAAGQAGSGGERSGSMASSLTAADARQAGDGLLPPVGTAEAARRLGEDADLSRAASSPNTPGATVHNGRLPQSPSLTLTALGRGRRAAKRLDFQAMQGDCSRSGPAESETAAAGAPPAAAAAAGAPLPPERRWRQRRRSDSEAGEPAAVQGRRHSTGSAAAVLASVPSLSPLGNDASACIAAAWGLPQAVGGGGAVPQKAPWQGAKGGAARRLPKLQIPARPVQLQAAGAEPEEAEDPRSPSSRSAESHRSAASRRGSACSSRGWGAARADSFASNGAPEVPSPPQARRSLMNAVGGVKGLSNKAFKGVLHFGMSVRASFYTALHRSNDPAAELRSRLGELVELNACVLSSIAALRGHACDSPASPALPPRPPQPQAALPSAGAAALMRLRGDVCEPWRQHLLAAAAAAAAEPHAPPSRAGQLRGEWQEAALQLLWLQHCLFSLAALDGAGAGAARGRAGIHCQGLCADAVGWLKALLAAESAPRSAEVAQPPASDSAAREEAAACAADYLLLIGALLELFPQARSSPSSTSSLAAGWASSRAARSAAKASVAAKAGPRFGRRTSRLTDTAAVLSGVMSSDLGSRTRRLAAEVAGLLGAAEP